MKKPKRRRFIIRTLSALGLIGLSAWLGKGRILTWIVRQDNENEPQMTLTPNIDDEICVLSSPISEGPYYIKSPYNFRNDKSLANVKEGTGLILSPKNESDNTVTASAKIGIKMT